MWPCTSCNPATSGIPIFFQKSFLRYQRGCYLGPSKYFYFQPHPGLRENVKGLEVQLGLDVFMPTFSSPAGTFSSPKTKPGLNRRCPHHTGPSSDSFSRGPTLTLGWARESFPSNICYFESFASNKDTEYLYVKKEIPQTAQAATLIGQDSKRAFSDYQRKLTSKLSFNSF